MIRRIEKVEMRKVHADLVEKGFMTEFSKCSQKVKHTIETAKVKQFYPWRICSKPDSTTTKVRLVVDPTMTRLNVILAKGENRIGRLNDIIVRSRVCKYIMTTDISKMYNQLYLEESSLPFSLFLYDESLDQSVPPKTWVMNRAWYGVASTGGQAGYAIEKVVEEQGQEYPLAAKALTDDRYVDDIFSGKDTDKERQEEVKI